jgi:hypothetical protein
MPAIIAPQALQLNRSCLAAQVIIVPLDHQVLHSFGATPDIIARLVRRRRISPHAALVIIALLVLQFPHNMHVVRDFTVQRALRIRCSICAVLVTIVLLARRRQLKMCVVWVIFAHLALRMLLKRLAKQDTIALPEPIPPIRPDTFALLVIIVQLARRHRQLYFAVLVSIVPLVLPLPMQSHALRGITVLLVQHPLHRPSVVLAIIVLLAHRQLYAVRANIVQRARPQPLHSIQPLLALCSIRYWQPTRCILDH